MRKATSPVFGTMLRAWRLRFAYVKSRNCFLRASDLGKNFLIELCPNDSSMIPNAVKGRLYRVMDDAEKHFELSPVLRSIKAVHKPFTLILDDDGEIVDKR